MSVVRRRCVFFVSGFDPKGASFYHALYKQESAKQSLINDWYFEVGARKRLEGGNSFWSIRGSQSDCDPVNTHYEFMRWDDVVRQNWPQHTWTLWRDVVATTFFNLRHGSLWQMFKLSWPPAVALFAPFVLLLMMLLGAPILSMALGSWAVLGLQWPVWIGLVITAISLLCVVMVGRHLESRYNMYWLTRSYAFTARQALGLVPELEARLDAQARRLVERIHEQQDDEILLVAHSSGAIMAVCILARAVGLLKLQEQNGKAAHAKVSFMSLGQCIPLLANLPQAQQFRAELSLLGQTQWIDWIDFSAPPDGCCFALSDPLALNELRPYKAPKLLSPRFAEMFESAQYRALRKDKFRMHFQYLMASDRAVDYDFFLITAADRSLATRYADAASVVDFSGLRPFQSANL
ncbi:hypothetical protein [Limnohabitans planktonicus]|uniref:Fungal lipase-like domain-containing protein n=1 Tax=Limnohabitans planktonicus II-D5 TaxID=1293045 RepID=A0A2T7UAS0_9BURK|nr:hypothetical protein [Limnohabitans planktonicus]PVE41816.1 hypothetical protein H663_015240 [Limnohabitans planktonicus II-D5]